MQYAAVLCRNWSNNCINMRSVAGVFLSEWAEADFCAILSVKSIFTQNGLCTFFSVQSLFR